MKPTTSTWLTRSTGTLLLVWLLVLLQGCTAMSRPRAEPNDPAYAPVRAQAMMQRDPESGAIFQSSRNYNFYGDTVALNIGDVLTVTLNESTRASKNAETKINKDSDISMPEPNILGKGNFGIATYIKSERDFQGKAEVDQSNSQAGSITVKEIEVLINVDL